MEMHKFHPGGFIISWVARLMYLGALTALVPFGALILTAPLETIPNIFTYLPMTAFVFMGVSALLLFLHHRNAAHVLAALGWMTLFPGLGGLFFLVFNQAGVIAVLSRVLIGFDLVLPVLTAVEQALPKLWLFVLGYIVLGLTLLHIASRLEHEHSLLEKFKKLFGPRVRIVRSR